jgi:hypothetical protein
VKNLRVSQDVSVAAVPFLGPASAKLILKANCATVVKLICIQARTVTCFHVTGVARVEVMGIVQPQASVFAILALLLARGGVDTVFLFAVDPARIMGDVQVLLFL